jgi:hypothetical protein
MTAYPEVVFNEASLAHEPSQELGESRRERGKFGDVPRVKRLLCAAHSLYRAVLRFGECATRTVRSFRLTDFARLRAGWKAN